MAEQSYVYRKKNHVANLNNARLSGKLCDVTIKVNDKEYRAHKIILAANLKYFETMFLSSFQESKQDVVTLQDVEETYFETFVSLAYTGEILLTDTNVLGLLELANYLSEDDVKESCIEFLKTHLKKERACQAFAFATCIQCLPLKNAAKQVILSNFGDCSLIKEFLDFDFESLRYILANESLHSVDSRQIFFEGLIRWILHDPENRRAYINNLLELIQIAKLNSDYLFKWACKTINDECDIVKNVMSFYNEKIQQTYHIGVLAQKFMLIGLANSKLQVQSYDSTNKKWSDVREIMSHSTVYVGPGIVLNNIFYYSAKRSNQIYLYAFYPETEKSTTLLTENRLTIWSAQCACTKFLYFCGGYINDGDNETNQVLRFDPLTSTFDTLPPMGNKKSNAAAIFFQGNLYVLGGCCGLEWSNLVEKYDVQAKEWTDFPSMCEKRWLPAAAVLDGKLYACGGVLTNSVEVYDPSKNSWQLVASMNKKRWRFLLIAREGKLLAIGGDGGMTIEIYDPNKDEWQIEQELSLNLKIVHPRGIYYCK